MRTAITSGIICVRDSLGLEYYLCRIEYEQHEDEHFLYRFVPDYSVLSLLNPPLFQGIPGLDLSARKAEYIRTDITPVFISERTPGEGREDVRQLLDSQGMEYLNRLEWLIRTETRYSGDPLYVRRNEHGAEKQTLDFALMQRAKPRGVHLARALLEAICRGDNITMGKYAIDDVNRAAFHTLMVTLYAKERLYLDAQRAAGVQAAIGKKKYPGRKPKAIDDTLLYELISQHRLGRINSTQAARRLGVSRATFYRRLQRAGHI